MPLTVVFPADRPEDATYASLAAQVEAGLARVIQDRRCGNRRKLVSAREYGRRMGLQRRQAVPLPGVLHVVVTA